MAIYGTRDGRFIVKKLEVKDKVPVSYTIPYFTAVSSTGILAAFDPSAGAAATEANFSAQPPYPARLSVQAVAAGTAGGGDKLKFAGYDARGNYVTELVQVVSTAGTSAAAYKYTNNAFAKLVSITPDDALHKSTDVNVGWDDIVGLPYPIATAADILTYQRGLSHGTTAPTVNTQYHTVDTNGLTTGSTLAITWLTKFQE